jgi:hypothetical protein
VEFGQWTLENWQSEFLQLFSFVVVSAVLIHHGSSESKDGTERIEQLGRGDPHDASRGRPPPAVRPMTCRLRTRFVEDLTGGGMPGEHAA